MFGKIILSLTVAFAVCLAPAAPIEVSKILASQASCCARTTDNPCQHCPFRSNQTSSASTCCSAQAPCFVVYSNTSDNFVAGVSRKHLANAANDAVIARAERPPVPPPRVSFA
jgi:hypothetical protein